MTQIRQTRIFVPRQGVFDHDELWAWTAVGRIVAPIINDFREALTWYWFTRYDITRARMQETARSPKSRKISWTLRPNSTRVFASDTQWRMSDSRIWRPNAVDSSTPLAAAYLIFVIIQFLKTWAETGILRSPERRNVVRDAPSS
jgi:hypothetical protein